MNLGPRVLYTQPLVRFTRGKATGPNWLPTRSPSEQPRNVGQCLFFHLFFCLELCLTVFLRRGRGTFSQPFFFYSKKIGFKTTKVGRVTQSPVGGIPHRAATSPRHLNGTQACGQKLAIVARDINLQRSGLSLQFGQVWLPNIRDTGEKRCEKIEKKRSRARGRRAGKTENTRSHFQPSPFVRQ